MKYLLSAILIWGVSVTGNLQAKVVTTPKTSPEITFKAKNGGVPNEINYQGWLGNATDTIGITDVLGMIFRLYTSSTGGSPIWNEAHIAIPVNKGIFNVYLGETNPLPANIFTGDPLWLEIQVMTDTLSPRKKLVSVGYAIKSENADNATYADTANYITGANVDGKVAQANHADTADYVLTADAGAVKFNVQTDPTEYTTSNTDWTEVMTFSFLPPSDSTVITELTILCDMKGVYTNPMYIGMSIGIVINALTMGDYTFPLYQYPYGWVESTVPKHPLWSTSDSTYISPRIHCPCYFTGESSYSIRLYLKANHSSVTAYLRNTTLAVKYIER